MIQFCLTCSKCRMGYVFTSLVPCLTNADENQLQHVFIVPCILDTSRLILSDTVHFLCNVTRLLSRQTAQTSTKFKLL